jgi:hypothetical protein
LVNIFLTFTIKNGLKNGNGLLPLLFNFALQYAIKGVWANQDGLKLNGTHQFWVYADDVNILGGSVHTVKKNTETLIVIGKEIVLVVDDEDTKYTIMSRGQNAVRSHNIKTVNSSFEKVEDFIYLGKILMNKNFLQAGIKRRWKPGNVCYHSVQNILSFSLLFKNIKIKIYRTVILSVILYGCKTCSLTLREERKLRVFENRVLSGIFGPNRDEVTG